MYSESDSGSVYSEDVRWLSQQLTALKDTNTKTIVMTYYLLLLIGIILP